MQIRIIAVGQRLPGWINQGVEEYQKRFPRELKLSLTEIQAGRRSKSGNVEKAMKEEHQRILDSLIPGAHLVILDERGRQKTTLELADNLRDWMQDGEDICLVIGGADGIHSELKKQAREIWSLSALTLPHGLARVLLMEQLYRAWTVVNKHPYHRE